MYNFKEKHSNSSRTIIAIFFKLTIEKLTKFRNLILHGSFIYNCRCNLYYCLTLQELEHLCLLKCHNASDRTRREWTSRIILCDVEVNKTDIHLAPFKQQCWSKTASENSITKFSQEPSNLAHTESIFFVKLYNRNKLNRHIIKMKPVHLQCILQHVCPDSHPFNSVIACNNLHNPWGTKIR